MYSARLDDNGNKGIVVLLPDLLNTKIPGWETQFVPRGTKVEDGLNIGSFCSTWNIYNPTQLKLLNVGQKLSQKSVELFGVFHHGRMATFIQNK